MKLTGEVRESAVLNDDAQDYIIQSVARENIEEVTRAIEVYLKLICANARFESSCSLESSFCEAAQLGPRQSTVSVSNSRSEKLSSSLHDRSMSIDNTLELIHFVNVSGRSKDTLTYSESVCNASSSPRDVSMLSNSVSFGDDFNLHAGPFNGFMVDISYNSERLLGRSAFSKVYRASLHIYRDRVSVNNKANTRTVLTDPVPAGFEDLRIEVAAKKTSIHSVMFMSLENIDDVSSIVRKRCSIKHSGIVRSFLMFFLVDDSPTGAYQQPSLQLYQPIGIDSGSQDTRSFSLLTLLEISRGGTLSSKLSKSEQLSELEIRNVLLDILPAVQYLHEVLGVVHNDIKPHNILLFPSIGETETQGYLCDSTVRYKLADFGHCRLARPIDEIVKRLDTLREKIITHPSCKRVSGGTILYMSPESCLGMGDSTSNDVWSIGITVFQLATGQLPWRLFERATPEIVQHGFVKKFSEGFLFGKPSAANGSLQVSTQTLFSNHFSTFGPVLDEIESPDISPQLVDFVKSCLEEDLRNRPTCRCLMQHPFLRQGVLVMQ